jgi:hypothetical protein
MVGSIRLLAICGRFAQQRCGALQIIVVVLRVGNRHEFVAIAAIPGDDSEVTSQCIFFIRIGRDEALEFLLRDIGRIIARAWWPGTEFQKRLVMIQAIPRTDHKVEVLQRCVFAGAIRVH